MLHNIKATAVAAALLPAAMVTALLDKPAMRSNLDAFNPGLTNALKSPTWTVKQWAAGTIPQTCKDRATAESVDPKKVTTYEVTYADCGMPWLICRHADAPNDINTIIDRWGRVPVHMRQFTAHTLFVPQSYTSAYALGQNLVFKGNMSLMGVYVHEATHAMEYSDAFNASVYMSDQTPWLNAYNADTAVPDDYARNNQHENLAQFPGLVLYDKLVAGGIKGVDANVVKIKNQFAQTQYQGNNGKYGGWHWNTTGISCSARWGNDPAVSTSSTTKLRRAIITLDEQRQKAKSLGIAFLTDLVFKVAGTVQKTECKF